MIMYYSYYVTIYFMNIRYRSNYNFTHAFIPQAWWHTCFQRGQRNKSRVYLQVHMLAKHAWFLHELFSRVCRYTFLVLSAWWVKTSNTVFFYATSAFSSRLVKIYCYRRICQCCGPTCMALEALYMKYAILFLIIATTYFAQSNEPGVLLREKSSGRTVGTATRASYIWL